MMKYLRLIGWLLLAPLFALTSCSETEEDTDTGEFTYNWQARNDAYFRERMTEAQTAIAAARAAYGDAWADHCEWRVYPGYRRGTTGTTPRYTDSVCCRIIERGTGSGCPLSTDSVRINYKGRLMPTDSYPEGRVFDHSGLYEADDYVFNPQFAVPVKFRVGSLVEGMGTALMYMHIGDRWRVYIPQQLGYGSTTQTGVPAYSVMVFDTQLKAFYRAGVSPGTWQ